MELDACIAQTLVGTKWDRANDVCSNRQVTMNDSDAFIKRDKCAFFTLRDFLGDTTQNPLVPAWTRNRHGDANRSTVGRIHPRVVRDGEEKGDWVFGLHVSSEYAAAEDLAKAVGGDEAEATESGGAGEFSGAVPPVHNVVGVVGHIVIEPTESFDVAIAQFAAHSPIADEGRVADDEIGFGPVSAAWVAVVVDGAAGGFVGNFLAGDGVAGGGFAVPLGDGLAVGVEAGFDGVALHEGVATFDVVEVFDDGFGRDGVGPKGAEIPLEVADPENEIGDDGGTGVDFNAEELMRVHGEARFSESLLWVTQTFERIDDFSLQALQVFEGDVEEIAGAAGGVEDTDVAEPAAKITDFIESLSGFTSGIESERGGLDYSPFFAEGFDDGGKDEAFDVGAGGEMCAEAVAFVLVEGAFEESAEDGGFDILPLGLGGFDEEVELGGGDREGFDGFKEAAIEAEDVLANDGREATIVHGLPEGFDHEREIGEVVAEAFEQAGPGAIGEEMNVFGEAGENAAHEEARDELGFVRGF